MVKGATISKSEDNKLHLDIPELPPSPEPVKSPRVTRSTSVQHINMELNTLFKFIKSYDGCRETLNSFLINCTNAHDLATEPQKPILFKYILSQLQGKAELACSVKDFTSWDQLREFLRTQFSEQKHYTHLLAELQESKQGPQENVSQFALRVESCLSQLLTEVSLACNNKKAEIVGRTAAMEDLALHHFLMGLHPQLSNIVRCRSPKNLNTAISLAISEERIQLMLYKRFIPQPDPRTNTNNVRRPPPRFHQPRYPSPRFPAIQQRMPTPHPRGQIQNAFCRYCKTIGHDIQDCKKREFYNNRYNVQPQNRPSGSNPNYNFRNVNYVEEIVDENVKYPEALNE